MEPRPQPRRNEDHEAARRERRNSRVGAALAAALFVAVCGVIALVGSAAGSSMRPDSGATGASGLGGAQAAPTHLTGPLPGQGPRVVSHDAPIHIAGRLSAASGGTAIGNTPVTVWVAYAKGASAGHRVMRTRTRADGTYSLTLPAGPSRKVGVSFGGTRAYRPSRTPTVFVPVAGKIQRFHAPQQVKTTRGASIRFRGAIGTEGLARHGHHPRVVVVERRHRRNWQRVARGHVNGVGSFSLKQAIHRPPRKSSTDIYRARVPRQRRWPYAAAVSKPIRVRIKAPSGSPTQPHVVCFHRNAWHEAVRPNKCNLRVKGGQGFYYILRSLHWTNWGPSSATGRGRWRISDGKLRIHIRFWHPEWGWGPHGVDKRYFSRAKISGPHVPSDRIHIDVPHGSHI